MCVSLSVCFLAVSHKYPSQTNNVKKGSLINEIYITVFNVSKSKFLRKFPLPS